MDKNVRRVPVGWQHPKKKVFVPIPRNHMPLWFGPHAAREHWMMYDGDVPMSPAFKSKEDLALWLSQTGAPFQGSLNVGYKNWLEVIR